MSPSSRPQEPEISVTQSYEKSSQRFKTKVAPETKVAGDYADNYIVKRVVEAKSPAIPISTIASFKSYQKASKGSKASSMP